MCCLCSGAHMQYRCSTSWTILSWNTLMALLGSLYSTTFAKCNALVSSPTRLQDTRFHHTPIESNLLLNSFFLANLFCAYTDCFFCHFGLLFVGTPVEQNEMYKYYINHFYFGVLIFYYYALDNYFSTIQLP